MKTLFQSHFYLIKHKKNDHELQRHSNRDTHRQIADIEIHVLSLIDKDTGKDETKVIRLRTEFDWILYLKTQIPLGVNTVDSDYK